MYDPEKPVWRRYDTVRSIRALVGVVLAEVFHPTKDEVVPSRTHQEYKPIKVERPVQTEEELYEELNEERG